MDERVVKDDGADEHPLASLPMKLTPILKSAIDALCDRVKADDKALPLIVDLAVLIATADGTVDKAELEVLEGVIESLFGERIDPKIVRVFARDSRAAIRDEGAETKARAIAEALRKHDAVDEGLALGVAVALASEGVGADELGRIELVANLAGTSEDRVQEIIRAAQGEGAA